MGPFQHGEVTEVDDLLPAQRFHHETDAVHIGRIGLAAGRRCRSEAAFASLAGTAPLEASSGRMTRHRLSRFGDRQLNRALHTITLARARYDNRTQHYIAAAASNDTSPAACAAYSNAPPNRHLDNP